MNKFLYTATLFLTSSLISLMPLKAQAQVFINGELIQGQELQNFQTLLGYEVPSGRYWINPETGYWGYEGNSEIQGNVHMQIQQNLSQASDGDDRQYDSYHSPGGAGGYGSYASDGECSYFSSGGLSINTCDDNW